MQAFFDHPTRSRLLIWMGPLALVWIAYWTLRFSIPVPTVFCLIMLGLTWPLMQAALAHCRRVRLSVWWAWILVASPWAAFWLKIPMAFATYGPGRLEEFMRDIWIHGPVLWLLFVIVDYQMNSGHYAGASRADDSAGEIEPEPVIRVQVTPATHRQAGARDTRSFGRRPR